MTHSLKTESNYFAECKNGQKLFEVRKFDRPFKIGDTVILQETFMNETLSGKELFFRIGFVLTSDNFLGVKKGWCVFSLLPQIDLGIQ